MDGNFWLSRLDVWRAMHVAMDDQAVVLLGTGALASVRLLAPTPSSQRLAVKALSKPVLATLRASEAAFLEKRALERLSAAASSSPFLVKLLRTAQDADTLYFYLEAVLATSSSALTLEALLDAHVTLPTDGVGCVASCLAAAILHLHAHQIAHRDIKPSNICIDAGGRPVIVDFGCAILLDSTDDDEQKERDDTALVGTLPYVAPEVLSRGGHGSSVDWWSLGVVLFECMTGHTPFDEQDGEDGEGRGVWRRARLQWTHAALEAAHEQREAQSGALSSLNMLQDDDDARWGLVSLIGGLLHLSPSSRDTSASEWTAEHEPAPWSDASEESYHATLRSQVEAAVARAADGHTSATAEDEEEAAWAAAEREELFERAQVLWARTSTSWESTFASFGPTVEDAQLAQL